MTDIVTFAFEGFDVRAVTVEGEPHFVAKDVAERLGYANAADALGKHCKGVAKRYPLRTPGGIQEVRVLAEPDVLRLIIGSKLPAAERFERWVFEEVLPAIRRTGSYEAGPRVPRTLAEALRLAADQQDELDRQAALIEQQRPKVEALDRIATAEGDLCLTDAAKALQVPPKAFMIKLQSRTWIYRRMGGGGFRGYQEKVQTGYLTHKVTTVDRPDGTQKVVEQVLVTPKGLARLAELLGPDLRLH